MVVICVPIGMTGCNMTVNNNPILFMLNRIRQGTVGRLLEKIWLADGEAIMMWQMRSGRLINTVVSMATLGGE